MKIKEFIIDRLIAEKVMGWEVLKVGYFGNKETETKRQIELEEWIDRAGIESVGEYYIDIDNY